MTDRGPGEFSLHPAWKALASRLCVIAGATAALVSLMQDAPAWIASLRGFVAFLVARQVAKWGLMFLESALAADRATQELSETEES